MNLKTSTLCCKFSAAFSPKTVVEIIRSSLHRGRRILRGRSPRLWNDQHFRSTSDDLQMALPEGPMVAARGLATGEASSGRTILVLLLCAFINGLLWSAVIPFGRGHDEKLHFEVSKFIAEQGRLPVFGPGKDAYIFIDVRGRVGSSYALHPSLPYILAALSIHLVSATTEADILHAARLPSVFAGVVTVFLAYLVGNLLFPKKPLLQLALPSFVVFQPQFTFVSSYVNNDAFAIAATTLVVYLTMRQLLTVAGRDRPAALFLGLALGLVLLSKFNAYPIIPFALLGYAWSLRSEPRKMATGLVLVCFIALLVSGWWFLRNAVLYNGDFLALETVRTAWLAADPSWKPYGAYHANISTQAWLVLFWWAQTFVSFWAAFGEPRGYTGDYGPLLYLGFGLIVLGSLVGLRHLIPKMLAQWREPVQQPRVLIFFGCLLFALGIMLLSFVNSFVNAFQPQGRYLFPAIVPLAGLLVSGLAHFRPAPWRPDWFVWAGALYFTVANLLSLFLFLLPAYYPHEGLGLGMFVAAAADNAWFVSPLGLALLTLLLILVAATIIGSLFKALKHSPARKAAA